jgi:NAD(P)-dependent dehydrogenase (short-subunit alcohol dehydrogenase family)
MATIAQLFDLSGKVALITGGGRGLGLYAAEGLAEAGADVVICGRDNQQLERSAESLRQATGRNILAIRCDVSVESEVIAMVETVKNRHGRCDILLNNAGIGNITPTEHVTLDDWKSMLAINLDGMFLCCREVGKLMIEAGNGGSIINFSSENGQVGFALGMAAYATTKIGAVGLSRSLAVEWGTHNIRVNALLPGNMAEGMMEDLKDSESPMSTMLASGLKAMIPLSSFGNGDDIKGAVVYLASDAGRYVSGAKLVVDGAFTVNSGL